VERGRRENLLIPAMVIGTAAVSASTGILTLFTVDMASTFNVSIGVASQLATINYAGEFVFSLLMGILAIRFRHKPLIITGVLFVTVSTIGSFLAPDFATMQIFFALEGVGTVIFGVMSFTLFGDVFPPRKRAKAVSYVTTALWVTALINFPLSGFIANAFGWRYNFILNILPISLAGLILSLFAVPSKRHMQTAPVKKATYLESFRQVFTDKSATACLAGSILSTAGVQVGIFGVAFYRQRFSVSIDWIVLLNIVAILIFVIGSLVAGRLTNKLGAKSLAVTSTLLTGIFTMTFFLIPNIWGALFFDFLHMWFAALAAPAYICLALAQVPKSRGTMMSLNSATGALARTIAPAVGGVLLVFTIGFYGAVGLALGGMSVAAAVILFILAEDPARTQPEGLDVISEQGLDFG
jgi:predicted MFS family arabinose efflux permease